VLEAMARIAGNVVAAPVRRSQTNRWGATDAEVAEELPGDELIPYPKMSSTRAITIGVPPEVVWAWLSQIGHGRGGLYSYDDLENLMGCDLHSADRILEGLPPFGPGDLVGLGPEGYPAFRVASVDPPGSLVLLGADPKTREAPEVPVASAANGSTWAWRLQPIAGGAATRLVARQRYCYPPSMSVLWHVVEPIDFVMERRMLFGIKERAERQPAGERAARI